MASQQPGMESLHRLLNQHLGDALAGPLLVREHQVVTRRIDDVLGALARAVLEAHSAVESAGGLPVAAVRVIRLGERMAGQAAEFMRQHAPNTAWALVDRAGGVHLEVPRLGVSVHQPAPQPEEPTVEQPALFTDLHQWLLKVLLLQHAPDDLWAGPRVGLASIPNLAQAARVSLRKAYQCVEALERHGFLRRRHRRVALVRHGALVEAWFAHHQLQPVRTWPVRCLFGGVALADLLATDRLPHDAFVVGGFAACQRMGLLHAQGGRLEVHALVAPDQALEAWEVERCELRDADAVLLLSQGREAIRRGVHIVGGAPVVDPLQAALDVVRHEARGREQALFLKDRLLGWQVDP